MRFFVRFLAFTVLTVSTAFAVPEVENNIYNLSGEKLSGTGREQAVSEKNAPMFEGNLKYERRFAILEEEIGRLNGKIEELEYKVLQYKEMLSKDDNVNSDEDTVSGGNVRKNSGIIGNEMSIEDAFAIAINLLRSSEHKKAEIYFKHIVAQKSNQKHYRVAESLYWLGEISLYYGDFDKAAVNFLYAYKGDPQGKKSQISLLKLANALLKINKTTEACGTLKKIKNDYPSGAIRASADRVFNSNRCNEHVN